MSTKKNTQATTGRASKQRTEHLRIGRQIAFELFNEPEGKRSLEIIRLVSAIGAAVGDVESFDLRPEYLVAGLLDSYKACPFNCEGQNRADADEAYAELLAIVHELDEEEARDNDAYDEARNEAQTRKYLAMPEPEDKTSNEWRYWKLRRMERALRGDDPEAFRAARLEAAELIGEALARFEPGHVETVISILPGLIIDRQKEQRSGKRKDGKKSKAQKEASGAVKARATGATLRVPAESFKRRAVARTLAEARREGTEGDYESRLIGYVLGFKKLDAQTHFNALGFLAALYCKIKDMPVTNRQALFSDPDFVRALYPHIKLAFPEEAKAAFDIYFRDLAENAPHILDAIQREADKEGAAA